MKRVAAMLVTAAIFVVSARGQGFLNLDFESAYGLPGNPGNGALVSVANALPDWTAFGGPGVLSDVYYASNSFSGTEAEIGLEGGSAALDGSFSAALYLNGSISQTATVSADAESLEFEAEGPGGGGSLGGSDLSVTLGGQTLSFSALSQGPDYIVYGANIPAAMDGQMEALFFSCEGVGSGGVRLDNIEFSTSSVPEPGEEALIGVGVVLFGLWRRCLTAKTRRVTRSI